MTLRLGVLTISDRVSRGLAEDRGGKAVEGEFPATWQVVRRAVVPDDVPRIGAVLASWADEDRLDVIVTTGGTGISPTDVTPEATRAVAEREVPGIAEAIRAAGLQQTPMAMISRGLAVTRGRTLIINLPGSPKGAAQGTAVVVPILEHAVAIMHGGSH